MMARLPLERSAQAPVICFGARAVPGRHRMQPQARGDAAAVERLQAVQAQNAAAMATNKAALRAACQRKGRAEQRVT